MQDETDKEVQKNEEKPDLEENPKDEEIASQSFKFATINVNSLGAACKKNFIEYVKTENPDIMCIQETKLHKNSTPGFDHYILDGYYGYFYNSEIKKGYSGTAIYTKLQPISVKPGFNDEQGRVILIEYEKFYVINAYVPNAGAQLERLEYKVKTWNPKLKNLMDELSKTKLVILCGDLNVAHQPIDVYDTKGKDVVAGYTPEERKSFDDFLKDGYTDIFRNLYPEKQQFSFFGYRFNMKAKGYGWRLDYFIVPSKYIDEKIVVDCLILNANFSDHLPCVLLLDKEKILSESDHPIEEEGITVLNSGDVFKKSSQDEEEEEKPKPKPKGQAKRGKAAKKTRGRKK